jgi:hypothetical protein
MKEAETETGRAREGEREEDEDAQRSLYRGIGKFDVALFDKKSLTLALEVSYLPLPFLLLIYSQVFHKGKLSDDKIKKLQRRAIKYGEKEEGERHRDGG